MDARARAVTRCRKAHYRQYSIEVRKDDPIAVWLDGRESKQGAIKEAIREKMEREA